MMATIYIGKNSMFVFLIRARSSFCKFNCFLPLLGILIWIHLFTSEEEHVSTAIEISFACLCTHDKVCHFFILMTTNIMWISVLHMKRISCDMGMNKHLPCEMYHKPCEWLSPYSSMCVNLKISIACSHLGILGYLYCYYYWEVVWDSHMLKLKWTESC